MDDRGLHHESSSLPGQLRLVTWNVDFTGANSEGRLRALIGSLDALSPSPDLILLQEVHKYQIITLLAMPWVQANYIATDTSASAWRSTYGSITLARRSLEPLLGPVKRLQFPTFFGRDGLCTELFISSSATSEGDPSIRFINVHLDSLPMGANNRPIQLRRCADDLKTSSHGGAVLGDFNPVNPESDDTLIHFNGMVDAWLALKSHLPEESGYTWGTQTKEEFPPQRFDKVACDRMQPKAIEVLKCGQVERPPSKGQDEELVFWSDHCGVCVDLEVITDA